jgi:hypothetical protein
MSAEAAPRPRPRWASPWMAGLILLSLVFGSVTCMCGHMDWLNLAFLGPGVAFGWAWLQHGLFAPRALVVLLPTLLVGKALTDILFGGHHPLLPGFDVEYLLVSPTVAVRGTTVLVVLGSALALRRRGARARDA